LTEPDPQAKIEVVFSRLRTSSRWALILFFGAGCSGDPGGAAPLPTEAEELAKEARVTYADIVLASYEDSLEAARALDAELTAFAGDPAENGLEAARLAWLESREPYLQTEVYRFYEGPIDDDDGPEVLLNAAPLDESYIDYTADEPDAGIVNDSTKALTPENLAELNQEGGERNVSTGFHALEFLLWGQDFDDEAPGDRSYTDYVTDGSGTAENQDRRVEYLLAASALVVENLEGLVDAWDKGVSNNYRAQFLSVNPMESLRRTLTGMSLLAGDELAEERLRAPLDSGNRQDEHSPFSDSTKRDMIQDVQGVANVWEGSFERLDGDLIEGVGVRDVVQADDTALATDIDATLAECLELANALEEPFEREIASGNSAGNERVEALMLALNELTELLREVFVNFELDVPEGL
jgi:putative iron-regulated protein